MPALTAPELYVELARLTDLSPDDWRDFCACSSDQQAAIVQSYRDQAWTRRRGTLDDVLRVLGVLGQVAGDVSGVAGAVTAVAALRCL